MITLPSTPLDHIDLTIEDEPPHHYFEDQRPELIAPGGERGHGKRETNASIARCRSNGYSR